MLSKRDLQTVLQKHGVNFIRLSPKEIQKCTTYLSLLSERSLIRKLTPLKGAELIREFISDPLHCTRWLKTKATLVDVGSGGGAPAITIAIICPHIKITMIESNRFKAKFLQQACETLELNNVTVINERAEVSGRKSNLREQFDYATAKAVAPLPSCLELTFPLLKVHGFFLAQKGPSLFNEHKQGQKILDILKGRLHGIYRYKIDDRHYYISFYQKQRPTPVKFPRRTGLPQHKPIT